VIINLAVGRDVFVMVQKPKGPLEFFGNSGSRVFLT
jgi:hypothetical protein